uniref:SIS domain-containing protein n=1 Tax=Rhizobium sp. T1473 TaxID=555321 RepID=UPI001CD62344|nr:SIS domain-containing protein [Rhizobium sp. T1473]
MRAARRVEVFGTGPSSICADILATRLIWLGLPVHSSGSASMAHGLARALDPSSVAIGISLLGHNEETKNFLNIARKTGAYTIAISSRASGEVAEAADEVILFSPVGAWRVPGSAMHVPSVVLLTEYLCLCLEEAEALRSDQ